LSDSTFQADVGPKPGPRGTVAPGVHAGGGGLSRLWHRSIDSYPDRAHRFFYLGIVVVTAVVIYYQFYVQAAVTPTIIRQFGMTFPFFVYLVVIGNLVGAVASLLTGLADRWGRANLVIYGLLVTSLLVLFGLPNAPNLWLYAVFYSMLGFVEGVILVASAALVRDYSPQLGRGTAMGLWTMGPVLGSLTVAEVSTHTLNHLHAWQDQFIIAGITGLVVFAIAFVGLRDLTPGLRDQLMVNLRDRMLIEAKAEGIDVETTLEHPWRQMFRLNIVGPAFGIGLFLVVYYTLIAFLVFYMVMLFGYSEQRANSLGDWMWLFNAGALVVIGLMSDRLRVRKPLMVVGIAGSMAFTILFGLRADQPATGYYTFVWILSLLAVLLSFVFAPFMTAFTETVEKRNPALTATGLALWGWILRLCVAASLFILPYVVTSMTPLVEHGQQVLAIQQRYPQQVQTLSVIDPRTQATLSADRTNAVAVATAVSEISHSLNVTPAEATRRLLSVATVPASDLAYLQRYGETVLHAASAAPNEWQRWWWVCAGTQIVLFPFLFVMVGRWSPRRAKRDEEEHNRRVKAELEALVA
jgi:MFS family permease